MTDAIDISGAKVLVTGGAGFIGSSLVRQLKDLGASVIVVDNLSNGKRENIQDVIGHRVCLEVADIRDGDRMSAVFAGADIVYHLACLGVRHSIHDPDENQDVNAVASLNLLEIAKARGVGRFVYVSTSEIYGTAKWVPMTEDHPPWPLTVYGSSKLAGECYTRAYYATYGMNTVVVRPFNSFGPRSHHEGDSGEVIPKFMLRCLAGEPMIIFGDGNQTRDFTYVDDTARGILMAGIIEDARGMTFNIGSGKEIAINDLALLVRSIVGKEDAKIIHDIDRPGDVLRLYADVSKANQVFGFAPEIGIADGLRRLLSWYRDCGVDPKTLLADEIVYNWNADEAVV